MNRFDVVEGSLLRNAVGSGGHPPGEHVAVAYVVGETLRREECLALLAKSHVGRIAVSIGALPVVLPVNFMVFGDAVLFRTMGSSELFRASVGSVIAFEVDDYDAQGCFGWSVLVRGIALEVTEQAKKQLGNALVLQAWPLGEQADRFVIIPATFVSGQRFVRVP
jgi:nitroimidazol reductase NimA-like FMN-containing flavoprotein (pyridoxamine 5'-phosphate oxidase superfamily)